MSIVTVVRAPAGLGKTTLVLKAIAKDAGRSVEIYVPTHELAEEQKKKLLELDPQLKVNVTAGRSHLGTDGKPLCKKDELAVEIAKSGGEVYATLCASTKGKTEELCEHYSTCPYIAQFTPAQVTVYPHAYLPLERMRLEPARPDIAIIDESFFLSCIGRFEVPLSLLQSQSLGPAALRVFARAEQALTRGLPLFSDFPSFEAFEAFVEDYGVALKEINERTPRMSPHMGLKERRAALRGTHEQRQLRDLLICAFRDAWSKRDEMHALTYSAETQLITVHTKKWIPRFQERPGRARQRERPTHVLIIDANADKELIKQFFDVTAFHHLQTERQAQVIQCSSTRCSTTSLVPDRNADAKSKRVARQHLKELNTLITRLAKQHRQLLVVGPQAITGNPNVKNARPLIKAPKNVHLAHFNAIRGIDVWKDFDAIVVVGRNEPPIKEVEAIARSVFGYDKLPLHFANEWTIEVRGYRLKGHPRGKKFGVEVVCHPDRRIQSILEQLREGESTQAIDRLRPVHATEQKRVYLLSNIVLDLDVDCLVTWDEMINGGGRIEQAWNTLKGVMPLAPAWLTARFSQLWKSENAAKADVAEWLKECQFTNIYSTSNPTLFLHEYKPASAASQRAWSKCLSSNSDPAATRPALEALVGAVEMRPPRATPSPPRRRKKVSTELRSPNTMH